MTDAGRLAAHLSAIAGLDAATYRNHGLHAEDRVWVEKNCYIDVWIELCHAVGCDPVAMLPFTVAIDFEGDQWTFFKPSHDELRRLYQLDVQELNVWRSLLDHTLEHLADGKVISTEADAFWLPDTQGTDYRRQHTKTTIIINELDLPGRRLGYFHNASYHALEGEDFDKLFRLGEPPDPTYMPLYAETVRTNRALQRPAAELRAMSKAFLATHLARRPRENPIPRFAQRFERDLPDITERGLAHYHAWAFATIRQLGAAFELASVWAGWMNDDKLAPAAEAFARISAAAKVFILKAARAVNGRRALDGSATFAEMSAAWQAGMDTLARYLES